MKKTVKKLALNREDIRNLSASSLADIAGGISSATRLGSVCVGDCPSPSGGATCASLDSACPSGPGIATCTCQA